MLSRKLRLLSGLLSTVLGGALLALMLVGNGVSTYRYFEVFEKEGWRVLAENITEFAGRDDLVILCLDFTYHPFAYYLRRTAAEFDVAGWTNVLKFVDLRAIREDYWPRDVPERRLSSALSQSGYENVFVVQSYCADARSGDSLL